MKNKIYLSKRKDKEFRLRILCLDMTLNYILNLINYYSHVGKVKKVSDQIFYSDMTFPVPM